MKTTTDKLLYLLDTKEAIKNAIASKGVDISNKDAFRSYASKIESIQQGGGVSLNTDNDVLFFDYNGVLLYSYSKEEALALTQLPELPSQDGLICQGWNYSLDEMIETVSSVGKCHIGATYITDDGKTRLYINVEDSNRAYFEFNFYQTVSNGAIINWGDGTPDESFEGTGTLTTTHTYHNKGNYVITIYAQSGSISLGKGNASIGMFGDPSTYRLNYKRLFKVEIGSNFTTLSSGHVFACCEGLETITLPNGASCTIGHFRGCKSLHSIILPKGTELAQQLFQNCNSLRTISLPKCTNFRAHMFNGCTSLPKIVVPYGVNFSDSVGYIFNNCTSLSEITLPKTVTNIPTYCFAGCTSLSSVTLLINTAAISTYAFHNCSNLKSLNIGSAPVSSNTFYKCSLLGNINIRENATQIGANGFYECESMTSIKIPKNVKTINANAFYNCKAMCEYDFSSVISIPTLSNTNAFTGIPSDCYIIVPFYLYNDWVSTTNWSLYSEKIVPDMTDTDISILVEADDIMGSENTTTAKCKAIVSGILRDGTYITDYIYREWEEVFDVGYNTSFTDSVEKIVSVTFAGVTGTATINQEIYSQQYIKCKYNVSSTSSSIPVINNISYTNTMIVNGNIVNASKTYKFTSTGENEIYFAINKDIQLTNLYRLFYNCSSMTHVDMTHIDMSLATSTSTTSGTALLFEGCANLKSIILPESISHIGYRMFMYCREVESLTIKAHQAPILYDNYSFGYGNSAYLGCMHKDSGTNRFYVPIGSEGYDSGGWVSMLQNTSYCGFTKVELSEEELNLIQ